MRSHDEPPLTLEAFVAETWAPRAERRLAAKTWRRDSIVLRRHILHHLGTRPIAEIDAEDLVLWQESLEWAGVGSPTIIKAIGILSGIFREAARRPRSTAVKLNPVVLLDRPAATRRRLPLVWGPVVVERARFELLVASKRAGPVRGLMALRDAVLVSLMAMTGCRPGEALALRWSDLDGRMRIQRALSGNEVVPKTKARRDRTAPLPPPLRADLDALRELSASATYIIETPSGDHWVETDWRNFRRRHFTPALTRVEDGWESWRAALADSEGVSESVSGLAGSRPYDLGRHTHSALMLASGMSLQRLARIQGHGMRVLDQTYAEEIEEFTERSERVDPVWEINRARALVWNGRDPSTGEIRHGDATPSSPDTSSFTSRQGLS